jgi:hypothetical protein
VSKCEHQLLYYFRKNFPAHQLAVVISSVIQKYQLIEFMPLVESIRTRGLADVQRWIGEVSGFVYSVRLFRLLFQCLCYNFAACPLMSTTPMSFSSREFTSFSKSVRPLCHRNLFKRVHTVLGNPISHCRTLRKRSNGWECRWIWTRLNAF